jgi:hypothetical protein
MILAMELLKNSELSALSLSSIPSRQGMNIADLATDNYTVHSSDSSTFPSSLQEQDLPSLTGQDTTSAACGQVSRGVVSKFKS